MARRIPIAPRLDATHAWVEAFLPQVGWVGFDPTNNLLAHNRYIRTALGQGLRGCAADPRYLSGQQGERALRGSQSVKIRRFAAPRPRYAGPGRWSILVERAQEPPAPATQLSICSKCNSNSNRTTCQDPRAMTKRNLCVSFLLLLRRLDRVAYQR